MKSPDRHISTGALVFESGRDETVFAETDIALHAFRTEDGRTIEQYLEGGCIESALARTAFVPKLKMPTETGLMTMDEIIEHVKHLPQ